MPPDANLVEIAAAIARLEGRVDTLMWVMGGLGALVAAFMAVFLAELFSLSRRVAILGERLVRVEERVVRLEEGFRSFAESVTKGKG